MKKTFNNHAQIQQWLAIYADLSPNQRAVVDQHLASCEACTHGWRVDQELTHSLSAIIEQRRQQLALQPAAQPHQAAARFRESIRQSAWKQRWEVSPRPRWLAVAVTLLVLIFLGTGLGQVWGGVGLLTHVYATGTPQAGTPQVSALEVSTPPIATPQPDAVKSGEIEARSGIEAALGREIGVWGAQEAASFDRFIDPAADEAWRSQARQAMRSQYHWVFIQRPILRLMSLKMVADDLALVQIEMDFPIRHISWHVGRTYRYNEEDGRWYWSRPRTELWGQARTLETDHLIFEYQEGDANVVEEIAPRLEAAYFQVHETLQLDPDVERDPQDFYYGRKVTLRVVPEEIVDDSKRGLTYTFAAPGLFAGPSSALPVADRYAAILLTRLTRDLLQKAQGQRDFTLRNGDEAVVVDLQHAPDDSPSRGWDEAEMAIIRWLVDDSLATTFYQQLYSDVLLPTLLANHASIQLRDINTFPVGYEIPFEQGGIHAASTAFINYIVATYGRDMISLLVREMVGEADTWDELIPVIFSVSVAQFEEEWNAWMMAEYPAVQETLSVRAGIEASLALEFEARTDNSVRMIDGYLDPDADEAWQNEYRSSSGIGRASNLLNWVDYEIIELVIDSESDGDVARVRVHITNNGTLAPDVLEGRFYRRVDERWLLTSPDTDAWGMVYNLETPCFNVQYRELDAELVEAAAGQLELAYAKMLNTLDLPEERPQGDYYGSYYDGKFHYAIVPESVDSWKTSESVFQLPSPFFHSVPSQADSATIYAYDMLTRIGLGLVQEVYQQPTTNWWNNISIGINQWVLEDSMRNPPWRGSEYMAGVIQEFVDSSYPVTMDELLTLLKTQQGQAAGMVLMDYIAAVHGRNEIPRFMGSLNKYEGWDDLIPAVFDVTVEEFEEGWNAWLDAQNRASAGD